MHKKGFTLAEVLIILSIIGVVAALTIPALTKDYEKLQNRARFKKVYSTISRAVLMMTNDYGGSLDGQLEAYLDNTFCRYLNCTKICSLDSHGARDLGCWHATGKTYYLKGNIGDVTLYNGAILKDGTLLGWYIWDWEEHHCVDYYGYQQVCGVLYADVNGFKGPNQGYIYNVCA